MERNSHSNFYKQEKKKNKGKQILKVQCIIQCQLPKQNTSLWVAKKTEMYFLTVLEA